MTPLFLTNRISLREFVIGIVFVTVLIGGGFVVYNQVYNNQIQKYYQYSRANHITEQDALSYSIRTNVGDILAYGEIRATQPQVFDQIKGEYLLITQKTEKQVTKTREVSCGEDCVTTEEYTDWETVDTQSKQSPQFEMLGQQFALCAQEFDALTLNPVDIYTGSEQKDKRYVYYSSRTRRVSYTGVNVQIVGSIFFNTSQRDDCPAVYINKDIEQTLAHIKPNYITLLISIIVTLGVVTAIYVAVVYFNNHRHTKPIK